MTIIKDLMKLAREIGDVSARTESIDPGIATCLAAAAEIRRLREQLRLANIDQANTEGELNDMCRSVGTSEQVQTK